MLELPVLQHLLQDRDAAAGEAGRQDRREDGRPPDPRLLQFVGLGGQRHGLPSGPPLLEAQGPAPPQGLHQPLERLSRFDRGRRLAGRHEAHACAGRPADRRRRARRCSPMRSATASARIPPPSATGAVQAIEDKILEVGPENVAAFIGEPVQGAGGGDHPAGRPTGPPSRPMCRKYGILLVCDEVICGFGRLGQWFGHQHYGIKPDMIAMAKGLSSGYLPIQRRRRWPTTSSPSCARRAATSSTASPIRATRRRRPWR